MTVVLCSSPNLDFRFATTFATPYLLNAPYANLGAKVGFIFGGCAVLAIIFAFFCVPECKGRTLEEIDRLFLDGVPIRKFNKVEIAIQHVVTHETKDGDGVRLEVIEADKV